MVSIPKPRLGRYTDAELRRRCDHFLRVLGGDVENIPREGVEFDLSEIVEIRDGVPIPVTGMVTVEADTIRVSVGNGTMTLVPSLSTTRSSKTGRWMSSVYFDFREVEFNAPYLAVMAWAAELGAAIVIALPMTAPRP